MCNGRLVIFISSESSWRCTECGWIGWPVQTVDRVTGRILEQDPHRRDPAPRVWIGDR